MNKYLITGGAGFIGSHSVDQLLALGQRVVVLDNFSSGHHSNLPTSHPLLEIVKGDIRDASIVEDAAAGVTHCLHLAAQVSVVKSLEDPADSARIIFLVLSMCLMLLRRIKPNALYMLLLQLLMVIQRPYH